MNKNIKVQLVNGNQDNLFPNAYYDHTGSVIHDGLVTTSDRSKWNGYDSRITDNADNIEAHVTDTNIHLNENQRELLNSLYQKVYPIGCVYSSVNDTTPTFEGTVWDPIDTLEEEPIIYRWVRIG